MQLCSGNCVSSAVDADFDWWINEANVVCVRMGTAVDVCLSDRVVNADFMYTELGDHVVSIDDVHRLMTV